MHYNSLGSQAIYNSLSDTIRF